jgi:hypothetical protein
MFAPTEADPDGLQIQREKVVELYDQVAGAYSEAENQLLHKSHLSSDGGSYESLEGLLDDLGQKNYPASVKLRDQYDSLSTYIAAVEQTVSYERDVLEGIQHLMSEPTSAFLCEDEQAELKKAQIVFTHSVERGASRIEDLEKQHEALESLGMHIKEWHQDVNRIEDRATEYVELNEYLSDDSLIDAAESLKEEFSEFRDSRQIEKINHSRVDQLRELELRVSRSITDLKRSRVRYAEMRLDQLESMVQNAVDEIDHCLESAMNQGKPIESPNAIRTRIEEIREEIEAFRTKPYSNELSYRQLDELSPYEAQLDEFETFIQEKTRFDSRLDSHSKTLARLRSDADPTSTTTNI